MARPRKKKRTHPNSTKPGIQNATTPHARSLTQNPKSMVIRMGAGDVGSGISQLVKDLRSVMEPGTASRLSERKSNKLRDYLTMAGPLGVTHLMLFTRSATTGNTNLRIALTPKGPTLTFRVESYSLSKDVKKPMKHVKDDPKTYLNPPLLVMNNFSSKESPVASAVPKHLESLVTTIFQSLFPPINPQATPLSSIRRIMLLDRLPTSTASSPYTISIRHYSITAKRSALSSQLRRLNAAEKLLGQRQSAQRLHLGTENVPNLSRMDDVADYLLDPAGAGGYTSDSSVPGSDAEVDMIPSIEIHAGSSRSSRKREPTAGAKRGTDGNLFSTNKAPVPSIASTTDTSATRTEKRVIKLHELGPRLTLRLLKVEEGVCTGRVMWHEYITKTQEEVKQQEQEWGRRKREKDERRRIQRENVERKRAERTEDQRNSGVKDGGEDLGEESEGLVSEIASEDLSGYEDAMWEDETETPAQ